MDSCELLNTSITATASYELHWELYKQSVRAINDWFCYPEVVIRGMPPRMTTERICCFGKQTIQGGTPKRDI